MSAVNKLWDALIIGGGPAALNAALVLGGANKQTLLLDDHSPRNRTAKVSHNFLTRDKILPDDLLRFGREQLSAYPSVRYRSGHAVAAEPIEDGFQVHSSDGEIITSRKLLLATGIRDVLPPIVGIDKVWSHTVHHCPYCYGWELKGQPIGLVGSDESAIQHILLLTGWSRNLILFTQGEPITDARTLEKLRSNSITIENSPISAVQQSGREPLQVLLADGRKIERAALYVNPGVQVRNNLARQLGCALDREGYILVDQFFETTVSGVFAAGDVICAPVQSLIVSAAHGLQAAYRMNFRLTLEALR